MSELTPEDGIFTEAGRRLFEEMNQHFGSSVWGAVAQGIVEVENEMVAAIIELIAGHKCDLDYKKGEECWCGSYSEAVALIKSATKYNA